VALERLFRRTETNPDEVRMTLGEHLEELRSRLLRAIAALVVGAIVCYIFIEPIFYFLAGPLFAILKAHGLPAEMSYFDVTELFMMDIKLAVIIGFIVTAPYSLAQIWGFIAAGLYPHERRWVRRFIPVSIGLFFAGALFFLTIVMPIFLDFFVSYGERKNTGTYNLPTLVDTSPKPLPLSSGPAGEPAPEARMPVYDVDPDTAPDGSVWINRREHQIRTRIGPHTYVIGTLRTVADQNTIRPTIRIADYLILVLQMAAAFGIGFQVPVVVALLATLGIVETSRMAQVRRYVWFGIAVVAAIVTPSPDALTLMLLLVPMILLYEVGLFVGRMIERERSQAS
jgi:sec-independent protein translocase protein TatC